jgi:hypothetical protein
MREQVDDGLGPIAAAAGRLADDEPLAHPVLDEPRLGRRRAGMHHASQHLVERQRARDRAAGVDAVQGLVTDAGDAVTEPPGHAVHRRQDQGARADERADALGDRGQRRRLDGDDDEVLDAEGGGIVRGDSRCLERAGRRSQSPAVAPQGFEGRAACDRTDARPIGRREPRADQAADRARADDADLRHPRLSRHWMLSDPPHAETRSAMSRWRRAAHSHSRWASFH